MKNENLVPKVRFKGFSDPWEQRKLFEVTERVTRKNTQLQSTLPLTISAQYGLIDQNTFFDKQVASRDVSGYYLIKNGEFAYNKSYSKGYPVGTIKRLDKYSEGVLSTLYILFKVTNADSQFLVTYFEGNKWYQEVMKRATEGARNHGLLNISPKDFFNMHLFIPVKSEQYKVGSIILKISCLIAANEDKLEQLKTLKKLMMQKIFSQEWRFKGFTDPWEQRKLEKYITDYTQKTTIQDQYPILTSSQQKGLIYQSQYYSKGTVSKSNIGYFVIPRGYFTYRSRSDNGVFKFNRNDIGETGIVSYFYPVFKIENSDSDFFLTMLNYSIKKDLVIESEGTGQRVLSLKKFKNIETKIPYLSEQKRIGNLFNILEITIATNEDKLNQLKKLKKYLMQNMFV
ncbi:restriction endonuclease subunit S [Lactiplantibacillus plantarum]|nr:restriction endonuclease subunit S [Lactiplantibacillus plantarum]